MRGRCLGAIVDQLVLGRFLADLGRFLINLQALEICDLAKTSVQNASGQNRGKTSITEILLATNTRGVIVAVTLLASSVEQLLQNL